MKSVLFLIFLVFGAFSTESKDSGIGYYKDVRASIYERLHERSPLPENRDKNHYTRQKPIRTASRPRTTSRERRHKQNECMMAVWAGRLDVVKSLADKVDLNQPDEIGCSPVYWAASKGYTKIVEFLADKVDLNQADGIGCTPAWIAARKGHKEIVKFLADKVDLNRANKYGCTPVYSAAMNGHTEIVEFLADKVDLNRANNNGHTPFDIAIMEGQTKIVKILNEKNVRLEKNLLEFAATEEIKQIIAGELKTQSDFLESVREGQLDDVTFLAEKVDLNRADRWGRTFVWIAAWKGRTEIVKFLADKVDLNQADKIGDTPVHIAAWKGHTEIVKFLADKVHLNRANRYGYTPVHNAAKEGRIEVVKFLIEKKVKLEENVLKIAATEEIKQIIAQALKQWAGM